MVIIFSRLEVTTQDSVTPSFTISSALRSGSQTGPEVSYAIVGDQLWWTIDIPCMLYQYNYVKNPVFAFSDQVRHKTALYSHRKGIEA